MKRYAAFLLVIALALMLGAGCTATVNKETKALRNSQGELILDASGQPIMESREFSDEAAFNDTQIKLGESRKPVMSLKAPTNQAITLPPGTELVVWGRNGAEIEAKQYVPESVQVVREVRGVIKDIALPAVAIVAVKESANAKGNTTTNNTNTYTNSANNNQGNLATAQGGVTGVVNNTAVSGLGGGGSAEGAGGTSSIPVNVTNTGEAATTGDNITHPADGAKTFDLF